MFLAKATRTQDEDQVDSDAEREEKRLRKLSNIVLIDYIKNMSQLLLNELKNNKAENGNGTPRSLQNHSSKIPLEYEEHIQALEAQVRGHYSV